MSSTESSDPDKRDDEPHEGGRKIKHTVESMLKQMEMSNEEIKYRMENFDSMEIGKEYLKNLKCTKCNKNFQQVVNRGESIGVHPLLGVLMCDSCCDYYGDGNFSLDSEGEDKYCRWCGEGGTIFACSKCICGFCDACIEKHFGVDGLEGVKNDDDWVCYFCNNKPLWYLRSICFLAKEAAKNKHEQLNKKKIGRNIKRKRRKRDNLGEGLNYSAVNSSGSDSSSSCSKNQMKRIRLLRKKESVKGDESSSNGDEKENHNNSKRKLVKNKKQNIDNDLSSENEMKSFKKKSKINCDKSSNVFETKKAVVLEKLKSIWKLTQTITEVGLNSSRERLKSLSKSDNYKTLNHLKKEHEELKSCMSILVSSLKTASNSVDSIKEDLTFDTAKDERKIFQIQETKLKRLAKKYQEKSNNETSSDSDEDPAQEGLEMEKRKGMQSVSDKKNSMRDSEEIMKKKRESDVSSEKENKEGKNKSMSLCSDSGSEEGKKSQNLTNNSGKEDENKEIHDSGKKNDVMPLLKVKSFARMLHDNVYDKNKTVENKVEDNPVVIDLYSIDTDEGEVENEGLRDSSDDKRGNMSTRIPTAGENKSDENVSEMQENSSSGKKKKNGSFNDKSKGRNSVSESVVKSPVKKDDKKLSDEGNEGKKKKSSKKIKKKKKKVKKILSCDQNGESVDSSKVENDKNKKLSECESTEEKKDSNSNENNEKHLLMKAQKAEKIESSEEKNENKDSNNDKEDEVKKNVKNCLSSNEDKNSVENESAESTECSVEEDEKERKQSSSEDESMEKKDLLIDSISIDEKPFPDIESSSALEEEISSIDKKRDKQDSSDSDSKKSFNAEQESPRSRRNRKKIKEALKTSFEEYKRKRERFLNSKEKAEQRNKSDESKITKVLESSESESEQKKNEQKEKPRKKRILASSDEEDMKEITEIKSSLEEESGEENQNQNSDPNETDQSSDETSSDNKINKKHTRIKKVKKKGESVSSDSSEDEKTKKAAKKRKENSSESSGDEDEKKKKRRKNIKKILKKDSLQVETKEALKNEEERRKRLKERQKLFEELFPQEEEENSKEIILDFDPETKEPLVKVHKKLAKYLKPHQVKGVKFMWNNCFESVYKLEEESGSGCILAHCMGLGKTLQVITLIHTVMTHDLGVNTVLIVCPLSTVPNWVREFDMWLKNINTDSITLYDLIKYKKIDERRFYLKDWHQNGGVLVLSYDLFRTLTRKVFSKKYKKKNAKHVEVFEKVLLDPGPDLVICDEGHLLKNEDTALSKSINRIKTSRRIILTGTPLQNNLIEYHCMVQFVKPNILGTKREFCNRFVNPINNGQFEDSTELDVKIMKKRSHVLHSMLDGCIQRFDYSVLTPFLPEKHEYVLSISLTEIQAKVYLHFINSLSAKSLGNSKTASLFNDYHNLQRIWTHPKTMQMQSEREYLKEVSEDDSEGSLKDFIVSSDEESCKSGSENSDSSIQEIAPKKRILRSNANDPEVKKAIEEEEKLQEKHWWNEFYDREACEDLRESNKLVVLFSLLKYCEKVKDKVLVFSQSLYSLDLIEYFLRKIHENSDKNNETLCGHQGTWLLGSDYFRLDGSTKSETRTLWCKYFNKESNTRARLFLISTRAGGLGINLYGANRVVLFDASWNPSHDIQSIFRVYRFGQKKTCYIYRFLAEATMEEKIYERQVTKLSLAHRVVDEHQIERHYTMGNLQELYTFEPTPKEQSKVPKLPKDSVLADLLGDHKNIIVGYHEHDSLLENKQEEELTEEERKAAWKEYEEEKSHKTYNFDNAMQQQSMMIMQQAQFSLEGSETGFINPNYWNQMNAGQNFINPMFVQSDIPLDALQRGMQVGVTPLPSESLESYFMRILNRENWMLTKQLQ